MANPEDLGRYRLKRLLGRGALGQVWEALGPEPDATKFAVKIMHAADDVLALARLEFAREASQASRFEHPNVARVFDAGEAAGTSFMVMEFVEGTPFERFLGDESVTVEQRLRWLRALAEGLAALHEKGLVHRDLKPENVIVRPNGAPCIVDYGIAKWWKFAVPVERDEVMLSDRPFAPTAIDYAPPEAVDAHLYDELGDVYAWGAVAHALMVGHPPNGGAMARSSRARVPSSVLKVIERACAPDRSQRWDSMKALIKALDDCADEPPSHALAAAVVWLKAHSRPVAIVTGLIALGLLLSRVFR